jgi:hypothetical protein
VALGGAQALAQRWGRPVLLVGLLAGLFGCTSAPWHAGRDLFAPRYRVAEALGEPGSEPIDDPQAPVITPPRSLRPCCAFGMDLHLRGVPQPLYRIGNVTSAEDLGRHKYGAGPLAVSGGERPVDVERNGLVYTCRGGWVDTAHVRENADLAFYLVSVLMRELPGPVRLELDGDGATRVIEVAPISEALLARVGRAEVAAALAGWVTFQLSIWHELASWFGYENLPGYSERVSAFSPEDLYSNALGLRLGTAIAREGGLFSRVNYDELTEAWLATALEHLGAVPTADGREVMAALDGRWWNSAKVLPDSTLVLKRFMNVESPVAPWRLDDALGDVPRPSSLLERCTGQTPALPLRVPDQVGGLSIPQVVTITWKPGAWAGADFPWPHPGRREVTVDDFPGLLEKTRQGLEAQLGAGATRPGPP